MKSSRLSIVQGGDRLEISFGPRKDVAYSFLMELWLALLAVMSVSCIYVLIQGEFPFWVWCIFILFLFSMWIFGIRVYYWNSRERQSVFVTHSGISFERHGYWAKPGGSVSFDSGGQIWIGTPAPWGLRGNEFLGMGTWNVEFRSNKRAVPLLMGVNRGEAEEILGVLEAWGVPILADQSLRLGNGDRGAGNADP